MNLLLVDDHVLFREGVALLLAPIVADGRIAQAGTCEEALALIDAQGGFDLVLMDLGLPGMSGIEGIGMLREPIRRSPSWRFPPAMTGTRSFTHWMPVRWGSSRRVPPPECWPGPCS